MGPQGGGPGKPGNGQKPSTNSSSKSGQKPPQMSESQMKEMKANREAYEKELKGILTDAQYQTYRTNQKNRRPGGGKPKSSK